MTNITITPDDISINNNQQTGSNTLATEVAQDAANVLVGIDDKKQNTGYEILDQIIQEPALDLQERLEEKSNFLEQDIGIQQENLDDDFIQALSERYGIKQINLEKIGEGVFKLESQNNTLDKLPKGYMYKGGAARAVLTDELFGRWVEPRDIDIVYAGDNENGNLSNDLARRYSPDDFKNGFGVEKLESDYFRTRDFTINEVLSNGSDIYLTKQCFLDTVRGVVRVTDFEKRNDGWIKEKLLAKALRFLPVLTEDIGQEFKFANEDRVKFQGIDDFHMALHLDRALEQSEESADLYLEELKKRNLIDKNMTLPELFEYLEDSLWGFYFRFAPNEVIDNRRIDDIQNPESTNWTDDEKALEYDRYLDKYRYWINKFDKDRI